MNGRRIVALLATVALATVACGSRVPPLTESLAGGPGGAQAGPGGGFPGPGGISTTGPGGISTTGPGVTPPGFLPGKTGADCRGGRSDTGVTADTIKVGAVTAINGPLKGAFNAALDAVDAYFKMVNDAGGICGRKIQYLVEDDKGDPTFNRNLARQLVLEDEIFAFVGAHSNADAGLGIVSRDNGVPDIGFSLAWDRAENPWSYGVPGQVQKRWIGEGASGSRYLNDVNGIEQVAFFWLTDNDVSFVAAWQFLTAMMSATDNKIVACHEQPTTVLNPSFDQFVLNMAANCDEDVTAVYTTMENNANIRLAQAMEAQGFRPKVYAPTFTSYHPFYVGEDARGSTEGTYMAMPQVPFERCAMRGTKPVPPCSNAELQRYVEALQRYKPRSGTPGSFGGPAWGQAALFVEAAASCGADLTRRCLRKRLDTMEPFNPGGFLSPTRPGSHRVYTCDLLVQVRNSRFVELPRPAGHPGPAGAPDFWDCSQMIDVFGYFCANKQHFPRREDRDDWFRREAGC